MKTCCICQKLFDTYGNNPEPFDGEMGMCCDNCNERLVVPVRIIWGRDGQGAPLVALQKIAAIGRQLADANKYAREMGERLMRHSSTP